MTSERAGRFRYQPAYCEENVYLLCQAPELEERAKRVVFVTNERRAVALRHQRAARAPSELVVWDYHVILLAEDERRWLVWDLDTTLDLPIAAGDYVAQTFDPVALASAPPPRFRVLDANWFVTHFASDRSHMRKRDGTYLSPPPPWPPIATPSATSNLIRLLDLNDTFAGRVLDFVGFCEEFDAARR